MGIGYQISRNIVELKNSFTTSHSDILRISDGHTVMVNGVPYKGPAIIIGDDIDWWTCKLNNDLFCRSIRQYLPCEGEISQTDHLPINDAVRRVLRDIAVRGQHKGIKYPEYKGDLGELNTAWLHCPGGFIPVVAPGHMAVSCVNPHLPDGMTSFVVVSVDDKRFIRR